MRSTRAWVVVLGMGCTAFLVWFLIPQRKGADRNVAASGLATEDVADDPQPVLPRPPIPVSLNRKAEVRDGFRGDVHPLLHSPTRLEVAAEWTPVGKGRDGIDRVAPPGVYAWFTQLRPARPRQVYTDRDFSAFLPEVVGEVGQTWALDGRKVTRFLKQFHPRPSMHLVAAGRRAGPDGAFAILRAMSPSHLDIVFRIHAEFYLTPWDAGDFAGIDAWYTPAYFAGRVLVNQASGTVDYFRLGLATDKALNVHLTLSRQRLALTGTLHDIVRVERMELTGGDGALAERIPWTRALPPAEAQGRLTKVFYKSHEIDWVPFDQVAARARRGNRPIMAVVSWGAMDDQSC